MCVWGGGVGGGGYSYTVFFLYTCPLKKLPIRILDFIESWHIHILSFELIYHLICKMRKPALCKCENKGLIEEYLCGKYVYIHGCKKIWAIHISNPENRFIHILSFKKRWYIIYQAALKKGAIRHAHPYFVIYMYRGLALIRLFKMHMWLCCYGIVTEIPIVRNHYKIYL